MSEEVDAGGRFDSFLDSGSNKGSEPPKALIIFNKGADLPELPSATCLHLSTAYYF